MIPEELTFAKIKCPLCSNKVNLSWVMYNNMLSNGLSRISCPHCRALFRGTPKGIIKDSLV